MVIDELIFRKKYTVSFNQNVTIGMKFDELAQSQLCLIPYFQLT